MENKNICSIENISKYLINEYNAVEVSINEFSIIDEASENTVKIYKIEDENTIQSLLSKNEKEEILITIEHLKKNHLMEDNSLYSKYMNKISTGKLIVITLESDDNINLSGFTMQGSGEKLYNELISLMGEKIEKVPNPLDETISDIKQFKPYGNYFK
ncbi:MAG: hypothetical protein ACRC3Y_12170 [Romboutsia sp.]|uniref:hypothetical protein n=1 Tax=Romboutsia sp. TaxID=1965302 RepID=UPI003F336D04